jgi:hypothetical protein
MQKLKQFISNLSQRDTRHKGQPLLVSAAQTDGFYDFEVESYAYIERLACAFHDVGKFRKIYYDSSKDDMLNTLIELIFELYHIKYCDENVHAFIDAYKDNDRAKRIQIAEKFWQDFTYDMNYVDRAIRAFRAYPLVEFYEHEFDSLGRSTIRKVFVVIDFFHFDKTDEVVNRILLKLREHPEDFRRVKITQYRGVYLVKPLPRSQIQQLN